MNIVINTHTILIKYDKENASFLDACLAHLIGTNPEHNFIIIGSQKNNAINHFPNQLQIEKVPAKNKLLRQYWYTYTLPKILIKNKAALFINLDFECIIKTVLPQMLIIQNANSLSDLNKKYITKTVNSSTYLITGSATDKNELVQKYKLPAQKLMVLPAAANEAFLPLTDEEKESTKQKYSAEKEYFLFSGEIKEDNNLINLLKAFSFFKKRQKSNMQLVILTKAVLPDNAIIKSLQSYKYREEVKIYFDLPLSVISKINAAAYAFIWPVLNNATYLPVLKAIQCGVPVIVNDSLLMNEICGDAALFANAAAFENLADKMMLLFKDENTRNKLIEQGKIQSKLYTMRQAADLLWQNILKSVDTTL